LRGETDRPLPNPLNLFRPGKPIWPGGGRYWLGLLYEVCSDFGRSVIKPLVLLALMTAFFAEAYFYKHLKMSNSWSCVQSDAGAISEAIYLAIRKSLILPGLGQDQRIDQAYACLYGVTTLDASLENHAKAIPVIPDGVAYLGITQSLISAVLIFLSLLAVRNHFRIK
jgi:hypothetical protein